MADAPRCAHCGTIKVSRQGTVCADCTRRNQEAARRLLEDLGKA